MLKALEFNNSKKQIITLYHGSKSGIQNNIRPISRKICDFGKGFYMGTNIQQPLTLICNYTSAQIYTLNLDLSNLKILNFELDLKWAFFIAYNREKLEEYRNTNFYKSISDLSNNCDLVIGYIADDRMFYALEEFFQNNITDKALLKSLSALKLGKQYVAITQKACNHIQILDQHLITENERKALLIEQKTNRINGIKLSKQICKQYRREGNYFDEIIDLYHGGDFYDT